ncbi:MAG: (Fe-S)-binding protein [Deltaproteobacteria bacterium]|nr:(Fe-S)-binding protein [Deltaproteobacteria bacterium]
MSNLNFDRLQLLELDACIGCRVCADFCPAVKATSDARLSGVYRMAWQRDCFKGRGGWLRFLYGGKRRSPEAWRDFAETVYRCTLCGQCQEVCPAGLHLKDLWLDLRAELIDQQANSPKIDVIKNNLNESFNVFGEDNDERAAWVEDMDDAPEDGLVRDQAEVIYFTGCTSSFYPLAQRIPIAVAETLIAADVDFTLLGADEWCCGFPMLGAGLPGQLSKIVDHNLSVISDRKAQTVVFACPSCYLMWKEHYPKAPFRLLHITEYLGELRANNRLALKNLDMTVTYHDPCDLGRGARTFDAPRRLIHSVPGVKLVELARNREQCTCCGGGGNLEMIDAELSGKIAADKIEQVLATGAQAVVTACQQCVRTMATYVRRNNIDVAVMDLSQLVRKALKA